MRKLTLSMAVVLACVALLGARSGEIEEYAGQPLSSEDGLVVVRIVRQQSDSSSSMVLSREYKELSAIIVSVDGKRRFTIKEPDKIKAFILPAGRWYLSEVRTPKERDLPKIVDKQDAKIRSFEVLGGSINFAGVYNLQFVTDSRGMQSVNVSLEFPPEAVAEAAEAWPDTFAAHPLMYCPLGRKCKTPADFKM